MHPNVDTTGHEQGEYGITIEDDPDPQDYDSRRMRDVLDRATIDRIEELHGAVVRAEAEQRFGLLRGKRTRQVAEAEAAEQAFLSANGFASYNDFRLRIRRSTALHDSTAGAEVTWEADDNLEPDYGSAASGSGWEPRADLEDPDPREEVDLDDEFDAEPDDERPEEGSALMGPPPDTAPASVPPSPAVAPRAETPGAAPDFRRLTEPLFATLQAETDRFVASRLEEAERHAADIVARASREANEILSQAARAREAAKAMADDVARRSEAFLSLTEELPARVSSVRDGITAELRSLREVVDAPIGPGASARPPTGAGGPPAGLVGPPAGPSVAPGPVTPGPVAPSAGPVPTVNPGEAPRPSPFEPTGSWTPGPRVAPPPPISLTAPPTD